MFCVSRPLVATFNSARGEAAAAEAAAIAVTLINSAV